MKNRKPFIVLAALAASTGFAIAQDEAPRAPLPPLAARAPVPPPPGDALFAVPADEARLAASQDQLKQAERAMQLAQARIGGGGSGSGKTFAYTLGGGGTRSGSMSRVLVIPKDASDAKNLAEVVEDMNVMAHILDKAASGDDKATRAMGITVFGRTPGGGAPQNLYLEGYGAVFFENVNYPLLPLPAKENEAETKEKTNSEWEEARKEMARPSGGTDAFAVAGENFERFEREFSWGGTPLPYDADKVEDLKKDLIAALKNVANIRKLKADETVTVVVTGANAGGNGRTIKRNVSKPVPGRDEEVVIAEATADGRTPASTPGKLILRTRKADAEAFQNGKLNADEFRKKVTVMLY